MKKLWPYIPLFLLIICLAYFIPTHNFQGQRLKEAEGQITAYQAQGERIMARIQELEAANARLVENEARLVSSIAGLEKTIANQQKVIDKLEANRPETPPGCEAVVNHYLQEIEVWKSQFSLVQNELAQYQELTRNLKLQLAAKDEQIALLKDQLARADAIMKSQKDIMRDLEKILRSEKRNKKFQYISAGIAAGALAVSLISK